MRSRWISLTLLVVLSFVTALTVTNQGIAADEHSQVAQSDTKGSGDKAEATDAKKEIQAIHEKLEHVKKDLTMQKKYSCCIKPTCDFCALTVAMCPCGKNLSEEKPVCPECLAGWKSGQGVLKKVKPSSVQMAPDDMLKEMMEMKAKMLAMITGALKKMSDQAMAMNFQQVALKLDGLHCDACAVKTQTALENLPGVKDANVNLENEEAIVRVEQGKVTVAQLIEAVQQAGFKASVQ